MIAKLDTEKEIQTTVINKLKAKNYFVLNLLTNTLISINGMGNHFLIAKHFKRKYLPYLLEFRRDIFILLKECAFMGLILECLIQKL